MGFGGQHDKAPIASPTANGQRPTSDERRLDGIAFVSGWWRGAAERAVLLRLGVLVQLHARDNATQRVPRPGLGVEWRPTTNNEGFLVPSAITQDPGHQAGDAAEGVLWRSQPHTWRLDRAGQDSAAPLPVVSLAGRQSGRAIWAGNLWCAAESFFGQPACSNEKINRCRKQAELSAVNGARSASQPGQPGAQRCAKMGFISRGGHLSARIHPHRPPHAPCPMPHAMPPCKCFQLCHCGPLDPPYRPMPLGCVIPRSCLS